MVEFDFIAQTVLIFDGQPGHYTWQFYSLIGHERDYRQRIVANDTLYCPSSGVFTIDVDTGYKYLIRLSMCVYAADGTVACDTTDSAIVQF